MSAILSFLLGILGVVVGLGAWRREHVGRLKMEVAEDVLALYYEASDALRFMRNPVALASDEVDLPRKDDESDDEFSARRRSNVVLVRYEQRGEVFSKLRAMRYRFMALVGPEGGEPIESLNSLVNDVLLSGQSLSRLWGQNHSPMSVEATQKHHNLIQHYESSFWEGLMEEDKINTQLLKATAQIENYCRKLIEGEDNWWSKIASRM